jgi:hypothetical protein
LPKVGQFFSAKFLKFLAKSSVMGKRKDITNEEKKLNTLLEGRGSVNRQQCAKIRPTLGFST